MQTKTPTLETFGARLALIRWDRGLNMKEAATVCGIAPATWRSWELDGMQPRDYLAMCRLIADRLGVDLQWLVFGPGDDLLPRLDSNQEPAGYRHLDVA